MQVYDSVMFLTWEALKRIEKIYQRKRTKNGKVQAIILKSIEVNGILSAIGLELENQGQKIAIELSIDEYEDFKTFLDEFEDQTFTSKDVKIIETKGIKEIAPHAFEITVSTTPADSSTSLPSPKPIHLSPEVESLKTLREEFASLNTETETAEVDLQAKPEPVNKSEPFDASALGIPEAIPIVEPVKETTENEAKTSEPLVLEPEPSEPEKTEEEEESHELAEKMTHSIQEKFKMKEEFKKTLLQTKQIAESVSISAEPPEEIKLTPESIFEDIESLEKEKKPTEYDNGHIDYEKEKQHIGDIKELFGGTMETGEQVDLSNLDKELENIKQVEEKFDKLREYIIQKKEEIGPIHSENDVEIANRMKEVVDILPEGPARDFVQKMIAENDLSSSPSEHEKAEAQPEKVEVFVENISPPKPSNPMDLKIDFIEAIREKSTEPEKKQEKKKKIKFW